MPTNDSYHEKHLPDAKLLNAIRGYEMAAAILRDGDMPEHVRATLNERLEELREEAKRRGLEVTSTED